MIKIPDIIFHKGEGFSKDDHKKYKRQLQQQYHERLLPDEVGKYIIKYMPKIKQIDCRNTIKFIFARKFGVLKSITPPKYKLLRIANFNECRIESLENLYKFYAPHLKKLILTNNKIFSLKPMIKGRFLKIKQLHLTKNHIKDYSPIVYCLFPYLKLIKMDNFTKEMDVKLKMQWIIKLQSDDLRSMDPFYFD